MKRIHIGIIVYLTSTLLVYNDIQEIDFKLFFFLPGIIILALIYGVFILLQPFYAIILNIILVFVIIMTIDLFWPILGRDENLIKRGFIFTKIQFQKIMMFMGIEIEFKNISEHPRCANKINTGLRKDPSSGNTSLNLSLRDETKCEICYNGVEKGQYAYVMKCCDSLFHYKHAIRWFQRFSSCPYCRKSNVKKNYLMIIAS